MPRFGNVKLSFEPSVRPRSTAGAALTWLQVNDAAPCDEPASSVSGMFCGTVTSAFAPCTVPPSAIRAMARVIGLTRIVTVAVFDVGSGGTPSVPSTFRVNV